jgi:Ca-activated chloride channel family protein
MMIPLFVLFYFIVTGKSQIQTIFEEKMLQKLTIDNDSLGRIGRNILLFGALFMMIVALARPVLPKGAIKAASKSIDLLVALDISKSMLATDRYPNRLTFAKKKIYELLDKFQEARVGVIAFADDGFIVAPMTDDKNSLKFLIENLNTDALSTNGTNLLVPILKAKEFLKDDDQKILLLFTDGGDQEDFSEEIKAAKEANISVYIYAIGTMQGTPIPYHGEALKDSKGDIVISRLNRSVKRVAIETGGAYIEGGYQDKSIDMIIKDIKEKFRMQTTKSRKIQDFKELFYYPLALAVFLMLTAFSSLPRASKNILLLPLLMASASLPSHAGFLDFHEIKRGFEHYQMENYRDAIQHFEKVARSRKDAPSYYDLGNAYYQAGLYKEAVKAYKHAYTNNPELLYKIFFNLGNAYYKQKRYEKALDAYLFAKKFKTEPDLEYNIALTKKHLKKRPPKPKKNPSSKQKQKQKKQQNNKNEQNRNQNQQKNQQSQSSDKEKQKQKGGQKQQKRSPISKAEMKKWERKLQKSRPKTMPLRFKVDDAKREKNAKPW